MVHHVLCKLITLPFLHDHTLLTTSIHLLLSTIDTYWYILLVEPWILHILIIVQIEWLMMGVVVILNNHRLPYNHKRLLLLLLLLLVLLYLLQLIILCLVLLHLLVCQFIPLFFLTVRITWTKLEGCITVLLLFKGVDLEEF